MDVAWQKAIGQPVEGDHKSRAWLERPRGASKTTDIACMIVYALFVSKRRITGVAAAGKEKQAGLIKKAVQTLLDYNEWLRPKKVGGNWTNGIEVGATYITNPATGSSCEVISSDAATSYGHNCHFYILDEITHWTQAGEELWHSLSTAAAKRTDAVLCTITNARLGRGVSWQWHVREKIREESGRPDSRWYFHCIKGPGLIPEEVLHEERRTKPRTVFERLWLNEWQSSLGDGLDAELVDAALTESGPMLGNERGFVFTAGLDIGIRNDATSLVVTGRNVGWTKYEEKPTSELHPRIRAAIDAGLHPAITETHETIHKPGNGHTYLADSNTWIPSKGNRVSLEAVRLKVLEVHRRFGLSQLSMDPSQGEHIFELLRNDGVPVVMVPQTSESVQLQATTLLDAVRDRHLHLYPNRELIYDLKALMIKESSKGFRFVSPRSGQTGGTPHGDSATALMLALVASRNHVMRQPTRINRPLVYEWDNIYDEEPAFGLI